MIFSYKKLWKLLIDKKMLKKDLIKQAKISPTTIASMSKGKSVSLETLAKICIVLNCEIGDIVELENI
jgi:DNA-binding Xre family transcriptional regulator